ncbi:hypothetical protein [Flavisolibacter nicotianae]|uniref:hypothetical protein n=1 Tax=Flavisolibacter nicotianae TaxID=2364882 RepID=UPI0013C4D134|nr:hypothetical protein [Flavisolibacter nicotianae]
MKPGLFLNILLLLLSTNVFAQKILNEKFEASKGKWQLPLKHISLVEDNEKRKHSAVNMFDSTLRLITDSAYKVFAVHDAEVVGVFEVKGEYTVVSKYGDYFISYQRLSKPSFSKEATLKAGQYIASLVNRTESQYSLELTLTKENGELDARTWFNWSNAANKGLVK